jgi:hypothetical protein
MPVKSACNISSSEASRISRILETVEPKNSLEVYKTA